MKLITVLLLNVCFRVSLVFASTSQSIHSNDNLLWPRPPRIGRKDKLSGFPENVNRLSEDAQEAFPHERRHDSNADELDGTIDYGKYENLKELVNVISDSLSGQQYPGPNYSTQEISGLKLDSKANFFQSCLK